jgi:hypothetical protein
VVHPSGEGLADKEREEVTGDKVGDKILFIYPVIMLSST